MFSVLVVTLVVLLKMCPYRHEEKAVECVFLFASFFPEDLCKERETRYSSLET